MVINQINLFNEVEEPAFKQDFEKGVKICSKCKRTLPITKFATLIRKDLNYRRSACKECVGESAIVKEKLKLEAGDKPDICECCNGSVNEIVYNSRIVLDHCHDTGTFRGWICQACNVGIGKMGDHIDGLIKGIIYLSKEKEELESVIDYLNKIKEEKYG
tara:strand:+ start:65 stop:544 length:480 start_codon:yes stop_codon:yes gene_type:complete